MPNFIKENSLKLLAVLVCPVLAFIGTILVIAGQLLSIPMVARAGDSLWSLCMFLALPVGLGCSFVSWRMAHRLAEAKGDTDDLIEFLLGFSGLLMIVLGGVVSPLWQWIADLS